jgi:CheY-like chemotaxis protein
VHQGGEPPVVEGDNGARGAQAGARAADDQGVKQADHRSLRVLVVDDEQDVRNLVAAHLKRGGHTVLLAKDATEALAIAIEEHPDLAIVDIMMPGMDGYELTEKLREAPATEELPIIVLTARAGGADRAHAFRVGADAYVQKPFELQRLTDEIASVMMLADAA